MDLSLVQYLSHLGQGTIVDTLSLVVSSRVFLLCIWIVVMGFVVWKCKKQRKFVLLAFIVSAILFYLIGEWGGKDLLVRVRGLRLRPYLAHMGSILPIGHLYLDTSFPSSHMINLVSLSTVAIFFVPRIWPFALLLTLLMAFSRIHNGMHYPTDVLVGIVIGIFCGIVAVRLVKKSLKYLHN